MTSSKLLAQGSDRNATDIPRNEGIKKILREGEESLSKAQFIGRHNVIYERFSQHYHKLQETAKSFRDVKQSC